MIFYYSGYDGYDVSYYQDIDTTPQKIDFRKMKDSGASFVVIRAGQDTYTDQDFKDNWKNAKGILPRSAYWFGDKDSSGKSQALRFWNLVKDDQPEGLLFVDFENGSWTDWRQLYDFIAELQRLSGYPNEKLGIYTGYYFWMKYGPQTFAERAWFGKFMLWLAWYTADSSIPIVPPPWKECLIWQDRIDTNGLEVGVESKEIDHDKFNGDAEKFEQFMGGIPIPPEGEYMILYYADLKTGYTSNVRSGPGLSSAIVSSLLGPTTIAIIGEKTTMDNYDWYQLDNQGWIALTTSYTNFRKADSTSVPTTMEVTLKLPDGTVYKGMVNKQ